MGLILSGWSPGVYTDSELVGSVMRELSAPLRARRLCSVNALRCVVTLAVCSWIHFTVQQMQRMFSCPGDPQEDFRHSRHMDSLLQQSSRAVRWMPNAYGETAGRFLRISAGGVYGERWRSHCALASQARCGRGSIHGATTSRRSSLPQSTLRGSAWRHCHGRQW